MTEPDFVGNPRSRLLADRRPVYLIERRRDLPVVIPFAYSDSTISSTSAAGAAASSRSAARTCFPAPRRLDLNLAGRIREHGLQSRAVPHIRRVPARIRLILLVTEMLGRFLVQRRFQHVLGEESSAGRPGRSTPAHAPWPRPPSPRRPAPATPAALASRDAWMDSQAPISFTVPIPPGAPASGSNATQAGRVIDFTESASSFRMLFYNPQGI